MIKEKLNKSAPSSTELKWKLQNSLEEKLLANWEKPIAKLPVNKDLPRLIKNMSVYDPTGLIVFQGNNVKTERLNHIQKFIYTLTEMTEDKKTLELVKARYEEIVVTNAKSEISEKLRLFFVSFPEDFKIFKILKCIQQEIVVPPVMVLREQIYNQFPYKDQHGSWRVEVEFGIQNVSVRHIKSEQTHNQDPSKQFGFEWSFEMSFNKHLTSFWARVFVTDSWFNSKFDMELKPKVEVLLDKFSSPETPFWRFWKKPLSTITMVAPMLDLLCHTVILDDRTSEIEIPEDKWLKKKRLSIKSIPRISSLSLIPDITQAFHDSLPESPGSLSKLYVTDPSENQCHSLVAIITSIIHLLETQKDSKAELIQRIEEAAKQPSPAQILRHFLAHKNEDYRTCRLIKSFRPDVIFQAVWKFRRAFYDNFPFRDRKHSNSCSIVVNDQTVKVIHTGICETMNLDKKDYWDFKWKLELCFNWAITKFTADVSIIDWTGKPDIEKVLLPFLEPQVPFTQKWKMPSDEAGVGVFLSTHAFQTIIINRGETVFSGAQFTDQMSCVFKLMDTLSKILEPYAVTEFLHKKFHLFQEQIQEYTEKPIAQFLSNFLKEGVLRSGNRKLLPILCCFQSGLFAPVLTELYDILRKNSLESQPQKDKDRYSIVVEIKENEMITVSHKRKEESRKTDPKESFQFEWKLKLEFDKRIETITKVDFKIVDWSFNHSTSPEIQKLFLSTIKNYLPPHLMFTKSWEKPAQLLNWPDELPKLIQIVDIFDIDGIPVYKSKHYRHRTVLTEAVINFISTLTRLAEGQEVADKVEAKLTENFSQNYSFSECIEKYFYLQKTKENNDIETPTMKILKSLLPHVVKPFLMDLHTNLKEYPFQLQEGSRKVHINFKRNGALVVHRCIEQSASQEPSNFFTFEWEVKFGLEGTAFSKLEVLGMEIITLSFHEQTAKKIKYELQSIFANIIQSASAFQSPVTSVSVSQLLQAVLQTLHASDKELIIQNTKFENVNVVTLLECLDRTLNLCPNLPSVFVPSKKS